MSLGLCRLCAALRKQEVLTTIDNENQELCQQVLKCCQVEIRLHDNLPKGICNVCVQSLQTSYEFYKKVQESQESLTLLYGDQDSIRDTNHKLVNSLTSAVAPERCEPMGPDKPKACYKQVHTKIDSDKNAMADVYELLEIDGNFTIEEVLVESVHDEGAGDAAMKAQNDNETVEVIQPEDMEFLEDQVEEELEEQEEEEEGELEEELEEDQQEDEPQKQQQQQEEDEDPDDESRLTEENDQTAFNGVVTLNPVRKWSEYAWLCYLCAHVAPSRWALQYHAAKFHNIRAVDVQYKCSDCQKICARYHTFLNHVRLRHQSDLAQCCDICDKQCASFDALAKHRNVECADDNDGDDNNDTDDDNVAPAVVQCDKCAKCFHNTQGLQEHFKSLHLQVAVTFKCNKCPKEFKRASALRVHESVHSGVKRYACDLCGHSFRQKANLEVHMNSHMNVKTYECKLCKKGFKTSTNLEKHALTHTDIRQFKCDHCDKVFRTRNSKLSHERTHTGEMPYPCTQCNRRFRFRSTLTAHSFVHTGEKPHTCTECKTSFTNWSNFNKHLKRRHKTTAAQWKKQEEERERSMYNNNTNDNPPIEPNNANPLAYSDEDLEQI